MPYDTLLCCGQGCPLNETCLRCTATIVGHQDFFGSSPYNFNTCHCDYYWDDRPSEEKVRQLAYQLWETNGYQLGNDLQHWFQTRQQLIDRLRNA